jgi:hypothetical protein
MEGQVMNRWILAVSAAAVALSSGALGGCKGCDDLIAQMCTDLGPEDCAYWKKHGWDQQMLPKGRRVNAYCRDPMMSDAVYPKLLQIQKRQVEANHKADEVRAKYK